MADTGKRELATRRWGASASWFPMLQRHRFYTAQPCSRHCGTRSPEVQREDTQGWPWGNLPLERAPSPTFRWSSHTPSPPSSPWLQGRPNPQGFASPCTEARACLSPTRSQSTSLAPSQCGENWLLGGPFLLLLPHQQLSGDRLSLGLHRTTSTSKSLSPCTQMLGEPESGFRI